MSDSGSSTLRRFIFGKEELPDPDWPIDHVPKEERKGLFSISAVLLGFVFFVGTMYAGSNVGNSMGFGNMLPAMIVGFVILGVYVAILSGIGAKTGLTTVMLSRYTFGKVGAKWADLLLGGTQVGWFGVTIPMIALPTANFFGISGLGIEILLLVWGILHLSTAYFGYSGMEKLSKVSVPALIVIGVLSIFIAIGEVGGIGALLSSSGSGGMTFGTAVTIVVGTFASGGSQAPNWARFAKTTKVGFWAGLIAFLLGNGFLFISGAVGGSVYPETGGDLFAVLTAQGLGLIGLIALALNVWTTNDNAAYAFGVAGSEAFNFDRKRPFVLAGGTVGIILTLLGAGNLLLPWLNILGQYVPPLGGVIIADFLLIWRMDIPKMKDVEFAKVRWLSILSYIIGAAVAVLTSGDFIPGVSAPQIFPGLTSLNGIIVAIVIQIVGHHLLEKPGILPTNNVKEEPEKLEIEGFLE